MSVGLEAVPVSLNPAPGAIVILERPLFKAVPVLAKSNCFCTLESWEAAIKAKSSLSPSLRVPPAVTVKLNCVLLEGQFVGPPPPAAKVQRSPVGEEEAVTCHKVSALL